MESVYRPIFGDEIVFYQGRGQNFMEESLARPEISTVVVFGFDAHTLGYQDAFEKSGKKLVFEGPGADPFIVFADADLDLALNDLMMAKFMYAGQTCTAPKRIFIQQPIYEEFLSRLVARVRKLKVGEPEDPETDISPVASYLAVERLKLYLEEAVLQGAKVLAGGQIEGNLVHPTVLRDATDEMQGMREEVFGPVAFTTSFASREEVLERARSHKYGLRASVFGGEEARQYGPGTQGGGLLPPGAGLHLREIRHGVAQRAPVRLLARGPGGQARRGLRLFRLDLGDRGRAAFRIKQGPKLISLETSTPEN